MGGPKADTIESLQAILDFNCIPITALGPYKNSYTKFPCFCRKCGYAWDSKAPYLKSLRGCPSCNGGASKTAKQMQQILDGMEKAITVIDKKDKAEYEVCCNVCNYRWQARKYNLVRGGCSNCSGMLRGSLEKTQQRLDQKDRKIKVEGIYTNGSSPLSCECQVCGWVWNSYAHTLVNGGRGCPGCAKGGFDSSKPGYLYYLRVNHEKETYWKIGITNRGVRSRFRYADRAKITILYCHLFEKGIDAQSAERNILNLFNEYRPKDLDILISSGNTELFSHDVLQMDHLYWGEI